MTGDGSIIATIWQENKKRNPVCLVSSNTDPTALATTVQRKQKDGSKKDVPSPLVVALYNKHMNGVDQSDQTRTLYSTARRSRKWWTYLNLFLFVKDAVTFRDRLSFICAQKSASKVPHSKKFWQGLIQEQEDRMHQTVTYILFYI